jgi:hypothetical protein
MTGEGRIYTLAEVLAGGFEARCNALSGVRYIWHGAEGIRFDPRRGVAIWVGDPSQLPEGDWFATELGQQEIAGAI